MNKRAVTIGPVFLVRSAEIVQALQTKQKDYPHLPDPTQIEVDITILNDEGGVPVVVVMNEGAGEAGEAEPPCPLWGAPLPYAHTLFLYTPSYVLELREKKAENGYYIERIEPVNVQMYDHLAQGALSLCATRWHLCEQEQEIPNNQSSHWQLLEEEWRLLQEQMQQLRSLATYPVPSVSSSPTLPSQHERYLDLAASLIEITHQLKNGTDNQEHEKDYLSAQQAAISLLKEGKAVNPYLLSALVDHRYQPYEVTTVPLQTLPSDMVGAGEQRVGPRSLASLYEEVVSKGLSVPDLLLIQAGPGDEHVQAAAMAALMRACSTKRQRVLLTAPSQKTLQDILAQLPEELLVMHLQQDGDATNADQSRSVKEQARLIQQQLLEKTEATLPHLTRLAVSKTTIDQWVERLHRHLVTLSNDQNVQQIPALHRRMAEIEQVISAPFQPALAEIAAAVQQLEENLANHKQRLETLTERHAAAEELRQKSAIGLLLNSVEQLGQNLLKRQQTLVESLQAEYDARKQAYEKAQETMQQVVREDPEYAWCLRRIQEIEAERTTALAEATKAASILQDTVRELVLQPQPGLPQSLEAGEGQASSLPYTIENEQMLQYYLNWYVVTRALLEQRHDLLQEWRGQLSKHVERLYPELFRYADVVCGTGPEIAATKELEQIEFDLVIVEDAGRMALPELLFLLVRARRAILVGDPQQGPLFDEQTVQSWQQTLSSEKQPDEEQGQQLTTYLTHSVFERLWSAMEGSASSTHTIRLTTHDEGQSQVTGENLIVSRQRGDE